MGATGAGPPFVLLQHRTAHRLLNLADRVRVKRKVTEACVTEDIRKDANEAPAGAGVRPDQQREHEENQHDEPLRKPKSIVGWLFLGCVVLLAPIVVVIAVGRAVEHPRTDDAQVFANFIGMAPQVDGPIMQLPIRDNQYVKAGDLLFVVDERPYRYALERALSQQAALEVKSKIAAVRSTRRSAACMWRRRTSPAAL